MTALLATLVLLAGRPAAQSVQVAPDSVLARPVTLALRNVTLADALARLRHEQGVPLAYSGDVLPPDHRVTLMLQHEPLGKALAALLRGSGLEVVVTRQGTVVIVRPIVAGDPAPSGPQPEVDRARLATGVRQLDQVVVIGTPVAAAPEREQPTAMTVIGRRTLAAAPHSRTTDLMRTLLPGVVLWDRGPGGPPAQITAVRGVSSFTTRALKTYVDGVELASADLFTLVDGRSIERIEVIRGPQGAALYGPDALNGILQIVTRKGQVGDPVLRARGAASAGPYERADLDAAVAWQDHGLGVTGGGARASFDLGGAFSQVGTGGEAPWLRTWSASGGGRLLLGPVALSGGLRGGRYEYVEERLLAPAVGASHELEERGAGLTAIHRLTARWSHTLVVGHHRSSGPREPAGSAVLTPTLPLGATHETATRTSLRYSTAWDLPLDRHEATLSAGVEHASRRVERLARVAVASRLSPLYDDDLRSTGGFGQARVRLGERLVATGGARAEWTSSVGENQGGPAWASAAGLSWTHPIGRSTLRLRGAWGRGIRPPEPGMRRGMATATVAQLANPDLAPEVQSGVELGLDVYLGDRSYARATWYGQRAGDLIQQVAVRTPEATVRTFQFQNVGAIRNRGLELEAGTRIGGFALTGLVYRNDSEVQRTAPGYTGELGPGDELPEIPAGVAAFSIRYTTGRVRSEVGGSWLGPWTGYDWAALAAAERGDTPVRSRLRDYWIRYPAVSRPYVALAAELGGALEAFLRVDNPANRATLIRDNRSPPLGRTTVVGIELRP